MSDFLGDIAKGGSVIDFAQKGLNFLQDATGYDYEKQDWLNKRNQERQFEFQRQLNDQQLASQEELLGMQQNYNEHNANVQFVRNAYLSDQGRNILSMRKNGLNPAAQLNSPTGQVSQPTTSSGTAQGGAAIGGSSAPVAPVHADSPSDYLVKREQASLLKQQARSQSIENQLKYEREQAKLKNEQQELENKLADKSKTDAEKDAIRKEIEVKSKKIEEMQAQIDYWRKMAENDAVKAAAVQKQADVAEQAQITNAQYLQIKAKCEQVLANAGFINANANKSQADSRSREVDAIIQKLGSETRLTDKEVEYYVEQLRTKLHLWTTQSAYFGQAARHEYQLTNLSEKQVKYYEWHMVNETLGEVLQPLVNMLPAGRAGQIMKVVQNTTRSRPNSYGGKDVFQQTKEFGVPGYGAPWSGY